jgi:hypothetical protein
MLALPCPIFSYFPVFDALKRFCLYERNAVATSSKHSGASNMLQVYIGDFQGAFNIKDRVVSDYATLPHSSQHFSHLHLDHVDPYDLSTRLFQNPTL